MPMRGPKKHAETLFEWLTQECQPPPPRERKQNTWIQPATWALIDARASLRKEGLLTKQLSRKHNQGVKAALKNDRQKRAANNADAIEASMAAGEMQEAWQQLKGWYQAAEDRAPMPWHATLAAQTEEREQLYAKVPPPGGPIPINVDPFAINDAVPEEPEIVGSLSNASEMAGQPEHPELQPNI